MVRINLKDALRLRNKLKYLMETDPDPIRRSALAAEREALTRAIRSADPHLAGELRRAAALRHGVDLHPKGGNSSSRRRLRRLTAAIDARLAATEVAYTPQGGLDTAP